MYLHERNLYCYNVAMLWMISYFEQENTIQPAEVFEDKLYQINHKFLGKLLYIHDRLQEEDNESP